MPTTNDAVNIEEFFDRVNKYLTEDQVAFVRKAYELAAEAHAVQRRKSGEPYIIHPIGVASILAQLQMDDKTLAAAFLHDVVEDTDYTLDDIKERFGVVVANLVDGVTKLGKIEYISKEDRQIENYRKMFLAMARDIRVVLIKLADRLHNMRTMKYMPVHKQQSISRETLEIYAPLAHRLGIYTIKWELEDLAFRYMEPDIYYNLVEQVKIKRREREAMINEAMAEMKESLEKANIKCEIQGRPKNFYSIHKKMLRDHKELNEIYDLLAIRVLVDTVKDCYGTLGIVHSMWRPIPGRFKDYVAVPKSNMYQSLHTTLIGSSGTPFEIQIRTFEMHRTAEYGIAAHWKYKEAANNGGTVATTKSEEEKLSWLRQILEWQKDMSDNKEFMSLLKSDLNLFSDTVFCFTPSGDVKNLPTGSTPVDFAYSIHSAVGNKMIGAKVNGKLVPIDYEIQNGDRIEIITSQNSKGPSRDWLNIVKSTQAKNKINQWFRSELKEENIVKGKELIAQYCKAKSINLTDINKPEYQSKVMRKYGFHDWDSALATLGHGGLKEGQVVNKMLEEYRKDHPIQLTDEDVLNNVSSENKDKAVPQKSKSGIIVKGLYDVAVHFSKCCSPVPGDEIVGFVTRGRGVSIHRTDCINIMNLSELEKVRLIDAEWQQGAEQGDNGLYLAEIKIFGNNRTGLLVDITRIFTEREIDISSINSKTSKQGVATISISFNTKGKEELSSLIEKIRQVESVIDIERTTG